MAGQPTGIAYATLPGTSGRYFSVTDSGDFDLTGDLEIRAAVALDDWTPAARNTIASTLDDPDGYALQVKTNGDIIMYYGDGSVLRSAAWTDPGFTNGDAHLLRLTWDISGPEAELWIDGESAGTKTPANTNAGSGSGEDLHIGAEPQDDNHLAGDIYFVEVFDGIATGQLVARFDARDLVHAS